MTRPLRILFVDDDPDIRTIIEMALSLDPDIEVCPVASAIDALRQIHRWSPDVCLFDVMMPGFDGLRLMNELRAGGSTVPVIFMTARARDQDLARYKEAGAKGVIAKPFDPLALPDMVRQLLAD